MVEAISALKALSKLVSEMSNMVVLDHIESKVTNALENLDRVSIEISEKSYLILVFRF